MSVTSVFQWFSYYDDWEKESLKMRVHYFPCRACVCFPFSLCNLLYSLSLIWHLMSKSVFKKLTKLVKPDFYCLLKAQELTANQRKPSFTNHMWESLWTFLHNPALCMALHHGLLSSSSWLPIHRPWSAASEVYPPSTKNNSRWEEQNFICKPYITIKGISIHTK